MCSYVSIVLVAWSIGTIIAFPTREPWTPLIPKYPFSQYNNPGQPSRPTDQHKAADLFWKFNLFANASKKSNYIANATDGDRYPNLEKMPGTSTVNYVSNKSENSTARTLQHNIGRASKRHSKISEARSEFRRRRNFIKNSNNEKTKQIQQQQQTQQNRPRVIDTAPTNPHEPKRRLILVPSVPSKTTVRPNIFELFRPHEGFAIPTRAKASRHDPGVLYYFSKSNEERNKNDDLIDDDEDGHYFFGSEPGSGSAEGFPGENEDLDMDPRNPRDPRYDWTVLDDHPVNNDTEHVEDYFTEDNGWVLVPDNYDDDDGENDKNIGRGGEEYQTSRINSSNNHNTHHFSRFVPKVTGFPSFPNKFSQTKQIASPSRSLNAKLKFGYDYDVDEDYRDSNTKLKQFDSKGSLKVASPVPESTDKSFRPTNQRIRYNFEKVPKKINDNYEITQSKNGPFHNIFKTTLAPNILPLKSHSTPPISHHSNYQYYHIDPTKIAQVQNPIPDVNNVQIHKIVLVRNGGTLEKQNVLESNASSASRNILLLRSSFNDTITNSNDDKLKSLKLDMGSVIVVCASIICCVSVMVIMTIFLIAYYLM